jgi:hypothetical protein
MRLIDADALIQKCSHAKQYSPDMFVVGQGYIMDAPTIETLKIGKWNDTYKSGYIPNPCNVCSECDCWAERRSNYCPNCGAKMG